MTIDCAPNPCISCPYRLDHPSGTWSEEEYEKLRGYDGFQLGVFLCHQTNATGRDTLCKGWVSVHADSVAVRLAMASGTVDPEHAYTPTLVALHASGNAAADAGQCDIDNPGPESRAMAAKLVARSAGRWGDEPDDTTQEETP